MRRRNRRASSPMPDVNLVPMMDVILTVLTFFIVVSMTLTRQQNVLNVTLPNATGNSSSNQKTADPMVVGLNLQGQIAVRDKIVSEAELTQQIQVFLGTNPQSAVLLKADRKVSYEQLAKILGTMQKVGGKECP